MELQIISSYLKFILIFLQLCGIATIPINHREKNRILIFWSFCTFIILLYIIYFVYVNQDNIFFTHYAVGRFIDYLQFITPVSAHITLLIVLFVKRTHLVNIWNELYEIIEILYDLNSHLVNKHILLLRKKIFLKWIFSIGIACCVEIKIMIHIRPEKEWSLHWYMKIFSCIMERMGVIYYIIFVGFIEMGLTIINEEMKTISFNNLKIIRKTICSLCKVNDSLDNVFQFFLLMYSIELFISLTTDLYWISIGIVYRKHPFLQDSIMCPVPTLISLSILFSSCVNLQNQVNFLLVREAFNII